VRLIFVQGVFVHKHFTCKHCSTNSDCFFSSKIFNSIFYRWPLEHLNLVSESFEFLWTHVHKLSFSETYKSQTSPRWNDALGNSCLALPVCVDACVSNFTKNVDHVSHFFESSTKVSKDRIVLWCLAMMLRPGLGIILGCRHPWKPSSRADYQIAVRTRHSSITQMFSVDKRSPTAPMTVGTVISSHDHVRIKSGCRCPCKLSFQTVSKIVLHIGD